MADPADLYQNARRSSRVTIRLLAIADLHHRPAHYQRLAALVQKHQPKVVALCGGFPQFGQRQRLQWALDRSGMRAMRGCPSRG